jgi:hypothetical protein
LRGGPRTDGHGSTTNAPIATTQCPSAWYTTAGAPFCYLIPPTGFEVSSTQAYRPDWRYKTRIDTDGPEAIEVLANRTTVNSDPLSVAALDAGEFSSQRFRVGKADVVTAGPVAMVRVDGARAFRQSADLNTGVHTVDTTVYRGFVVVRISCQTVTDEVTVQASCDLVLANIKISG